jgi:hypothetical protein
VVYVLVQIRKLLERCKASGEEVKPIWFFCNWAVHFELNYGTGWANELLTFADRIAKLQISWEALNPAEHAFMTETFSLDVVRQKLIGFLGNQGVRAIVFGHVPGWYWFIRKFSEVVSDCPVTLKGGNYIDEVTLEIVQGNASGTRLDMEWTFRRKDHPDLVKWVMPTFFENEEFNFGRNGAKLAEKFNEELQKAGLFSPWMSRTH